MNVLIINGHPRKNSFSEAMVSNFEEGAAAGGVGITKLTLADLSFNPNVICPSPRDQHLEDDIKKSQELISIADHVVFVYPTWWGTIPAILKGFIDRVFTPGFAFTEIEGGTGYGKLLTGKSAQIITTMDTPLWVYRLIYRSPGNNAMKRATLQFCGFNPVKVLNFSSLKNSSEAQRERWLKKVRDQGYRLHKGPISTSQKLLIKTGNWIKAIRLQFYPMTWIAYAIGAYGAGSMHYGFERSVFWTGYLWLFLVEISTVLTNEYFDFQSDQQNHYFGPFTGGSRVIVEKLLTFDEVKKGIFISLVLSFIVLIVLLFKSNGSLHTLSLTCGVLFVLALGYTVPPLRLSYRGLGELDVGVTHSFAVVICGYIFQGGNIGDAFPWLVSIPLFLAVLPSIILSGIPDHDADKLSSKNTIAVRLGRKGAAALAICLTISAAIIVIIFKRMDIVPEAYGKMIYIVIPHAAFLCMLIHQYLKDTSPKSRIDSLMIASLTYLIWFGLIPFIKLA